MQWKRAILCCSTLAVSSDAFVIDHAPQAASYRTDVVAAPSSPTQSSSLTSWTPQSAAVASQREFLASPGPSESAESQYFGSSIVLSAAAAPAAAVGGVTIADVNYDGAVPKTESDEYVVVQNGSKSPIDVSGYYVYVATTGTQGPTFTFPKKTPPLGPGKSVRIYTNEVHKETGGYSYGSGKAIWSNNGGLAVMRDAKGNKVCEFKYKPATTAAAKPAAAATTATAKPTATTATTKQTAK